MNKINLTPIIFGKDSIIELKNELKDVKRILLVTGKGSIKRNGLYEKIKDICDQKGIDLIEFWGIKPNPTNLQIDEAAALGIKENVDLIIAAGGGSAIDASKIIATLIMNQDIKHSWDIVIGKETFKKQPLDIISIVTLAGTASENNDGSVVTNEEINVKKAIFTRRPILAIEDASYTTTLSEWQTASGIFDCFSHITEQWFFVKESFEWTDNYNVGLLKTLINSAEKVMKDPKDLKARENILFTSSMALNGLSRFNVDGSDWGVHQIAHGIAGSYDTTHGATLALISPTYWEIMAKENNDFKNRAISLGKDLWGVSSFDETLQKLVKFINLLKLPKKYSDFKNITDINEKIISELTEKINLPNHLNKDIVSKVLSKITK